MPNKMKQELKMIIKGKRIAKIIIIQFPLLLFGLSLYAQNIHQAKGNPCTIALDNGQYMQVQVCNASILRVRVRKDSIFKESLLERYNILKKDWQPILFTRKDSGDMITLTTDSARFDINTASGKLTLKDATGKVLVQQIQTILNVDENHIRQLKSSLTEYFGKEKTSRCIIGDPTKDDTSPVLDTAYESEIKKETNFLSFSLNKTERFYGLGSASREHIQHRGEALRIWVKYQKSEAPSPFMMSTNGWGVFNNSTKKHFFDIGRFQKDKLYILEDAGEHDFYLFTGKSMSDIIGEYTTLTGKPFLLPKWAYGLAFGSNNMENQFNVLENAYHFRQEKIPCDIYWLEPQWMKKNYDFSTKKDWDDTKFVADLPWTWENADTKRPLFIQRLKDQGFKLVLWLCADQDLSIEEEDRIAKENSNPLSGLEHWFPHLTKFIDQGVQGFKLDPGHTLDEHPDRTYYNGLSDEDMHLVNQVLLPKQLLEVYKDHAGLRPFLHYCGGYVGIQHWCASTAGDNGGTKKVLYDVLNHGMTGHMNVSCDVLEQVYPMAPAMHMGFLLPWTQVNSWSYIFHPWFFSPADKEMFRYYAALRYSLIPYIYSSALHGALTGMPIVRALPLIYPDDPAIQDNSTEYLFGDNLLVAAFTNKVYLPEGNWIDYWTGKKYQGKQEINYSIPNNRGGALFIKAGAIIPYQQTMQYVDEKPADTLIMKIYPEGKSAYTLYEDDGISFKYKEAAFSKTEFQCKADSKRIELMINAGGGSYDQMPKNRVYLLEIISPRPDKIMVNSKQIPRSKWKYTADKGIVETVMNADGKNKKDTLVIYY